MAKPDVLTRIKRIERDSPFNRFARAFEIATPLAYFGKVKQDITIIRINGCRNLKRDFGRARISQLQ